MNERDYWNDTARDLAASGSPWGPGGHDSWKPNTAECMAAIRPALDLAIAGTPRGRRRPRFLDLGCGIGRFSVAAAQAFPKVNVYGVDISSEMIAGARRLAVDAKVDIEWRICDGYLIPDLDGLITAAWSVFMFQHIPNEAKVSYIQQVAALLVPGGVFRFQFCHGESSEFLAHRATPEAMIAACTDAGLTTVTMETGLLHPEWTWITVRK